MSKAIVIIDMPEKCSECVFSNPDGDWCPFHGEVSHPEYNDKKPDICPLIEFPERQEDRKPMTLEEMWDADEQLAWCNGYDSCINSILNSKTDI